ncbi:hypothetical protein ACFWBF_19995 [Streptomyces sp. NPDC060028]|uniref:hypothetical protein n=1 Tax=Streptomyces sp. NPDC060028 TaxID=3347041 RepID=UPI00369D0DAF
MTMSKLWLTATAAALALAATGAAYYAYDTSGQVTVESLCGPAASTPEDVAAFASTVVIATVADRTRFVPDEGRTDAGVTVSTLAVEKTLKGSAPARLTVTQGTVRAADGTLDTTHEPLHEVLAPGGRYTVAVLDRTREGGRWVWGAEQAPDAAAAESRWRGAASARTVLPEPSCDDTTVTGAPSS